MRNINRNFPRERLAFTNSVPSLEVTELEINNFGQKRQAQYIYPRHVCFNGINLDHSRNTTPKILSVNGSANEGSCQSGADRLVNLKETFYQVSDGIVKAIHLENLRQNLEKRLQTAKTKGDDHLVNLLEKEFQQLAS